mgnify:FL=1
MRLEIDQNAGFCFGVMNAIQLAEKYLENHSYLYCLGAIVHNEAEVNRLKKSRLRIIDHEKFKNLKNETVLIRAHGEPVETYQVAKENTLHLIEGTCPIVLRLQQMIRAKTSEDGVQVVIFGKPDHPEAIGLASQIGGNVQIAQASHKLTLDFSKPIYVYSQTTMDAERYADFCRQLQQKSEQLHQESQIVCHNSVCGKVANRSKKIREFAQKHDIIIFVSGKDSSNGNYLYSVAKKQNPKTYFISKPDDLDMGWLENADSVGISGATSTPQWLMEKIADKITWHT